MRPDDLSDQGLVVTADRDRWQYVFLPACRAASLPDGRSVTPERADPREPAEVASDRSLDLLEAGAVTLVDLEGLPPGAFALLSWYAQARPSSVLLVRSGERALPFELHDLPVRLCEVRCRESSAASRVDLATWVTHAAHSRARTGATEGAASTTRGNLRRRLLRRKNGNDVRLREAARALLAGDDAAALAALERSLEVEPEAPDLLLKAALLHREKGRWDEAKAALERCVAADPACAPAWRELGLVGVQTADAEAEESLARAVGLADDYPALVALSTIASRRGDVSAALGYLERALRASDGQLNLVLPSFVLRAARDGRVELFEDDRRRVAAVLEIRRGQARRDPPEDTPWSAFDAVLALLLLGEGEAAERLASETKGQVHASWETDTLAGWLDGLERAGLGVDAVRRAYGARPPRAGEAQRPAATAATPFVAEARPASWYPASVPCAAACPVGTDAGAYVALTARGRFDEAFRVARGPNPFASVCGRVCAAPCEEACRRGAIDEPVAIRAIKRFLTERHGVESPAPLLASVLDGTPTPGMPNEGYVERLQVARRIDAATSGAVRRVAVVGGGPAGLACAHDLAVLGHRVTLFEATDSLGGMMRHGIPEYRLPRDVLDREIDAIRALGIEVRTGEALGAHRTVESLLREGYGAVFLASGAGRGRELEVEGSSLDGVVRAIDFLINENAGFKMELGPRVVVVGGGNVAIDVARTARRGVVPSRVLRAGTREATRALAPALHGETLRHAVEGEAREVHVVARAAFGDWPAQKGVHGKAEVDEARREGVILHPLRGVRRIVGREGRVVGVELAEIVQWTDERGRYAPRYGPHGAEEIPCDSVLLAVGQEPDLDYLDGTSSLRRTTTGLIDVRKDDLATSLPGVFAGGDAAFGPRTLIEAVAEGKKAARSIHGWLGGARAPALRPTFEEVHPRSVPADEGYDRIPRVEPSCTSIARRTGIAEVEGSYDEEAAVEQASRCLTCHVQTVFDAEACVACGRCTDVCPYACLSLVPAGDVEVRGAPDALGAATWMVKDETSCIRCGLCAERCPTGAMTMERFDLVEAGAPA